MGEVLFLAMPNKLNSEFNYRFQVIGATPWAKIHNLKGFLEGRRRAVALEEVAHLNHDALYEKMSWLQETNAPKHEQMKLQATIVEAESSMVVVDEAYELNRQEIAILEKLLAECYVLAEPTRILGYTDEDMFEANAAEEFTANTMRELQSEIVANGRPAAASVLHAMANPHTLAAVLEAGLFPKEAIPLLTGHPPALAVSAFAALKEATMPAEMQLAEGNTT